MHDKLISSVRANIVCNVITLSIVSILVWTLPDIPVKTQSDGNICLDTDNGIKCDQMAKILHETLNYVSNTNVSSLSLLLFVSFSIFHFLFAFNG